MSQQQYSAALLRAQCISHCSVLLCKTGSQHACVTGNTPVKIHCLKRSAMSQHQYFAALLRTKLIPHCSVLLCKTGLVSLQVQLWRFSHQTSALQIRLTAGLCHCCDNCADLLLIQVCSDPTEMHCSVDLGKMIPKAVFSLICRAALMQAACTGVQPLCLGNNDGPSCRM